MTASRSGLPARYEQEWGTEFWQLVNPALRSGISVLDLGGGRRPTIAPERRPAGLQYVGLDASAGELAASPPGSYDETVVADAQSFVPQLEDRFDLIVAWHVLEHIRDLRSAADAFRRYATDRGRFVACLPGRWAAFALVNRALPSAIGRRLVAHLREREVETVFPAYYDHCDYRGLHDVFSAWGAVRVIPLWHGADYFLRLDPLLRLYVRYEDWAIERRLHNLATYYVIVAQKGGAQL